MKPATRLEAFPEYIFSRLYKIAGEVEKESGKKVLHLAHGIPDVRTSKIYLDKLCEFINDPHSHLYPPYGATKEFADALIHWYQQRFGATINREELYPLLGEKDGLSHLPLALLNEGDEILIPNPGYPAFSEPTKMVGAKPISYN